MARTTRAAAAAAKEAAGNTQLSSPPATPVPQKRGKASTSSTSRSKSAKAVKTEEQPQTPVTGRKRIRQAIKQEDDGELPHNLGTSLPTPSVEEDRPKKRTRSSRGKAELIDEDDEVKEESVDDAVDTPKTAAASPKKTPKKANYGLTPGVTPYPDYPHPTHDECREVVRLLEKVHGKVNVPKAIPPPSLDVAGCGEVPSVLDALVRTRLSANTTNKNSSTAFQGLVARFGTLKEGIGKGSVDWDAVRRAPQRDVYKAIERGGLADRKSKDIQAILQMVYEENQERKAGLQDSSSSSPEKAVAGAAHEADAEKQEEIAKATQNVISLDHLHLLSTDDAINKMLTYPGIGPKTASCVALFCLQRPSFAVDTHVFRLCQYLGWVPKTVKKGQPKVDRNTTFSHCDVRIPDELKYPLHYLLIRHGKTCPRCRAITGQASAGWEEGCPIEHLVKRHGSKKGGVSAVDRKKARQAAGVKDEDDDGGENGSDLSDVPDDD